MAESSHSSVSMSVPIFNGDNYDFWSIKMKTFFHSQDLWTIVETVPANPNDAKSSKALFFLQQALVDEVFPRIMGATSAKEAWDILKEEFHGSEQVRNVKLRTLRRELENIKMKDFETAKNYYARIKEIVNQMKAYGGNITNQEVVEKILVSITGKYDPIITAIEESKDITRLSVTELMGSLEAYEDRLSQRNKDYVESAFKSELNIQSQKSESGWKKSKSNFTESHKDLMKEGESWMKTTENSCMIVALPRKLLLGLLTLFISIIAMMVVFCTTLFIVFDEGTKVPALLAIALASIPVITFIWLSHLLLSRSA